MLSLHCVMNRFVLCLCAVGLIYHANADKIASVDQLREIESKVADVAARSVPITVALISEEQGSSGSGVITNSDGLILTAAHVIQGVKQVKVVFADGKTVDGKVLGANFAKDLAMVKIEQPGPWPYAPQGESHDLNIGDWVIAMGHAGGFDPTRPPPVRFGRVVSKGPGNFFTSDCTLIGGDSGGPVFDLEGRVIGINSNIGQELNINNHGGIDGMKEDWQRLLSGEQWGDLVLDPLLNEDMPVLGLQLNSTRSGLVVGAVNQGSKAIEADIRRGDIIVSIDGEDVRNLEDLRTELLRKQVGDQVTLSLNRDGAILKKQVKLVRRGDANR